MVQKIKLCFNFDGETETHLMCVSGKNISNDIRSRASELFEEHENWKITFVDEDGDTIHCSTDAEILSAIEESDKKFPKFFMKASPKKSGEQVVLKQKVVSESSVPEENPIKVSSEEVKKQVEEPAKQSRKKISCEEMQVLFQEFISDLKIQEELPKAFKIAYKTLRKNLDAPLKAFDKVLKKCPTIAESKLILATYPEIIQRNIDKVKPWFPILVSLPFELVAGLIDQLMSTIPKMIDGMPPHFDLDITNLFCQGKPQRCPRKRRQFDPKVHVGYSCDGCGMKPIVGTRYKCVDCKGFGGFDFCEKCECSKVMQHYGGKHTFLKIRNAKPHVMRHPFQRMSGRVHPFHHLFGGPRPFHRMNCQVRKNCGLKKEPVVSEPKKVEQQEPEKVDQIKEEPKKVEQVKEQEPEEQVENVFQFEAQLKFLKSMNLLGGSDELLKALLVENKGNVEKIFEELYQ